MNTDVAVVGGGPAGSVTALLLARAGYHVTLLERHDFPRAKPCGDCLSPAANRTLQRIGVWDAVLRAAPALLTGWQLTAPDGTSFSARFSEISKENLVTTAIALPRQVLDALLLDHAHAAGVTVLHRAHITDLLRDGDGAVIGVSGRRDEQPLRLHARLTVGADGLRSVVARRLRVHRRTPRLRKVSFTAHVPLATRSSLGEMRIARDACLGIAPVQAGSGTRLHNITLVVKQGSQGAPRGARSMIAEALGKFELDAGALSDADILASGPFDWPVRTVAGVGVALVGDAAGYYDPFTGQGIYQALAGAELLAEHAGRALAARRVDRGALRGYARGHRQLTAAARRVQRIIEFVCARPAVANLAFARIAREAAVARALIGVTGDLLPATTFFSPRLLMRLTV